LFDPRFCRKLALMKSLIVTCDDCGLSEGINSAALDLYLRGVADSASVLANFPATVHALDLFRANPGFSVGVHLNLTDGFPLTPVPPAAGLTAADGRFLRAGNLIRRALLLSGRVCSSIEEELTAQIELVLRTGVALQHLTTHLQFHLLPRLGKIVQKLARAYHVPWVRAHRLRSMVAPWNPLLDRSLGDASNSAAPDYMAVLQLWQGREPGVLVRTLAGLRGNIEMVVHAGIADDPTFPAYAAYGPRGRFAETQFLERCWPLLQQLGGGRQA
jgi:predicted glycoside hydrolase/deacetylase ChbG (UPF0249 family)